MGETEYRKKQGENFYSSLTKQKKDQFFNVTSSEAVFQAEIVLLLLFTPWEIRWPCESSHAY